LEDLVPRETGRDAKVDAKKHRAQARREAEDDKIGGGDVIINEYEGDRVKAMLLKQEIDRQRKQETRANERAGRVAAAQDKEQKTMEMLRQLARGAGYNVK